MARRSKQSAGILAYNREHGRLRVFLIHPGGPYWAGKDEGAWSIPKGEFDEKEEPLDAARREFREETGQDIKGEFIALAPVKQPSGKVVHAFAVEADVDADKIVSNLFEMEWPPRSGRMRSFPEVDRGAWFEMAHARRRIQLGQMPMLDELVRLPGTA